MAAPGQVACGQLNSRQSALSSHTAKHASKFPSQRQLRLQAHAEVEAQPSTSSRGAHGRKIRKGEHAKDTDPVSAIKSLVDKARAAATHEPLVAPAPHVHVDPLPEKNLGTLRGGMYPFTYDPVYGLPVVNDVITYGQVLRGMREGKVQGIYWFGGPSEVAPGAVSTDSRCLVRYRDGRVKQSVIPPLDRRMQEAMEVHGVPSVVLPPEPRHLVEFAEQTDAGAGAGLIAPGISGPLQRLLTGSQVMVEYEGPEGRRGPRVGPTPLELLSLPEQAAHREAVINAEIQQIQDVVQFARRMSDDEVKAYEAAKKGEEVPGSVESGAEQRSSRRRKAPEKKKERSGLAAWADRIQVSQDTQALVLKYVPIVGPIIGSAFIIGLYMLSRLVKGDLTDRMKMMDQEADKKKRTQLKEARIAFLEEELPALVAKGVALDVVRKKAADINKKLGSKLEISDAEVASTYEACLLLLSEGTDLAGAETSSNAADRIIAEEEAKERVEAQKAEAEGGGGGDSMSALMEMGKLNTARIRKATDPRILEVKRKVRQARRSMKRDSKVQLSDEIIFFDDVAGNAQAKIELLEVVDFFRKPEKFRESGAKAPKGVLLVGPPGNGKTLMARAVAGESGVAFISSSASEFIELYMGLGAARVRDLFNTARKLAPCIIFIDELDAVGRARRGGGQGNDERDNTVNQLLTEMDGFEAETSGIVVMGATNRKDVLDAALTRPGRFDRSIEVRRPDLQGRLEAVKVHLRDKPIASDIDYHAVAVLTGGMSGAQLAGVCNNACFVASREGRTDVTMADMIKAVETAKYGRSYEAHRFVSPARKRRFAVMEASISMVATLLPAMEPVEYVTANPSIKSPVGRTVLLPNVGRYTTGIWTKRYLREQLLVALAGRAGEELVYGFDELSSLNQHRLIMARQIVHKMLNAGMSDHPDFENLRTLGAQYMEPSWEPGRFTRFTVTTDQLQTRSEWVDTDMEMEAKLNGAYEEVKAMIERNRPCLDALVEVLLSKERVGGDEVRAVVEAHAHPRDLEARRQAAEEGVLL